MQEWINQALESGALSFTVLLAFFFVAGVLLIAAGFYFLATV